MQSGAQRLHQREIGKDHGDPSLTGPGFNRHAREGSPRDLPWARNGGRPFSFLQSFHRKVDIIRPSYIDEEK